MKRTLLLIPLILLSACAVTQETPQPTKTAVPPTATPAFTVTPEPSSTPTPPPEPYQLEDGVLLDWDEEPGEYVAVSEGIDALTITAEGVIVALDGDGSPWFVFENGDWVEIKIPKRAENHEQVDVADRYVTIVNEEGKTEEILESGTKVLVNPETGKYEYEFINGQWMEYAPRVMVVGENSGYGIANIQVSKEVIESCAKTVREATMFYQVIDGEKVEVRTGYDEKMGEREIEGMFYISWYGVLCGAVEEDSRVRSFVGVEMNSGDIMLITMLFEKIPHDCSGTSLVFESGLIPEYERQRELDTLRDLGRSPVSGNQRANAILNSPKGTPFYFTSLTTSSKR